jgi:AcrR family transcriptional regulator
MSAMRRELPVLAGGVVRERADAARNRERVLDAARRLFAERGAAAVTMDDLAAAAGVGKGTLYRRFADKSAVAYALLDAAERELQERLLHGPPPVGPGAAATDRLVAFAAAYVDFAAETLDLLVQAEAAQGGRLRSGAYDFWRQHCAYLFVEAGGADADRRAEVLLAALSAEQLQHWLRDQQSPVDQLKEQLAAVARLLTGD